MHGEGISTPRIRHEGWQPLIECAKHDFKIMYFPFYAFLCFLLFLCFFILFSFYVFYFFVVDKDISLPPTYPQVR